MKTFIKHTSKSKSLTGGEDSRDRLQSPAIGALTPEPGRVNYMAKLIKSFRLEFIGVFNRISFNDESNQIVRSCSDKPNECVEGYSLDAIELIEAMEEFCKEYRRIHIK